MFQQSPEPWDQLVRKCHQEGVPSTLSCHHPARPKLLAAQVLLSAREVLSYPSHTASSNSEA